MPLGGMIHKNVTPVSSVQPSAAATAPPLPAHQKIPVSSHVHPTPPVQPVKPTMAPTLPQPQLRIIEPAPVVAPIAPQLEVPVITPVEAPVAAAPKAPIDMGLPGGESAFQAMMHLKASKWRTLKPYVTRLTAVSLVIVLALGGFFFSQGYFKIRKVFKGGSVSAIGLTQNVNPQLLRGEGDGRVNILLLGRGGGNHSAPDLTDTLMIASIDPVNHTSTLLSIPRDMWVKPAGYGAMKINAAWETGKYKYLGKISSSMSSSQATQAGFQVVDQTISDVIGIPIHYNLLVDFNAFSKAVDTVNGVTINVPTDLVDPTMAWENNHNPVLAKAGVQDFNGTRALIYVRSRETTSDFARAQRQRAVLLALKDKAQSVGVISNPVKLAGLMSALSDNAQTDMSIGDASRLYTITKDIAPATVNSIGLADAPNSYVTTAPVNGQSTVQPKAGMFNYTEIQNYIRNALKDGYLKKEDAKLLVLNGSNIAGLASTKSTELAGYGYTITGSANAPTKTYTTTQVIDLTGGKNKYTQRYLEQRFKTTAVTALPDPSILPNGADFVIILGSDASISSKN